MEKTHILSALGLTEKESAVYLALIELGPATIAALSQKTGIHRPLIYKALPGMEAKGLVAKALHGKRQLYVPTPPETLEGLFESLSTQFHELVPQLRSSYESIETRPVVKYLVGKKEISSIFTDIVSSLKRGDIFYRYSSARDITKSNTYLPADYRKKRDDKQLERYVITSEARAKHKQPRLEREIRTVPKEYDLFDQDVTQIIYANKVAYIDYNTETALVIENSKIAEFQRRLFMLLYKGLKRA